MPCRARGDLSRAIESPTANTPPRHTMNSLYDDYVSRYRSGEWRSTIFCDMLIADLQRIGPAATVVDIGCGSGFDGSAELQQKIAAHAGTYIGVEPDPEAEIRPFASVVHRALFEAAAIAPASVDLAFSVMVVEHVAEPRAFVEKAADVLKDGGVFWAFTVDLRHWSAWGSFAMERLGFKDSYLDRLQGKRGTERYANYPVHYKLNTPRAVSTHAAAFHHVDFINLSRVGAEDFNIPPRLRAVSHVVDHALEALGAPGSNLAFRMVRRPRQAAPRNRESLSI